MCSNLRDDVTESFNVIDVTDFPQFKLNFLNIFVM